MELQRNSYRRRGDVVVSLNRAKVRVLLLVFSALLLLVFLLGYLVGRVAGDAAPPPATDMPPLATPPTLPPGDEPAPEEPGPATAATTTVKPAARPAPTTAPRGTRYAIVVRSISLANPQLAKEEADRVIAQLKTKGFRSAHYERITVPNKGTFYRVIAMEANYPSVAVAKRDIEAMKRRGEITTGWAVPLEE